MPTLTRLRVDPRPPTFRSIVDAEIEEPDDAVTIDDAVEMGDWQPVGPFEDSDARHPVFVDGVQETHARVFADVDGETWPVGGIFASYAAGAVLPGTPPTWMSVIVRRALIVPRQSSRGLEIQPPADVEITTGGGRFQFKADSEAGTEVRSLDLRLKDLRSESELTVMREMIRHFDGLIVADGPLPRTITSHNVVGFVKTPHRIELRQETQHRTICELQRGQRSPIYRVRRGENLERYRWFVSLRAAQGIDAVQSGLALVELDGSANEARAKQVANAVTAKVTRYASRLRHDSRAPQSLLPVIALEDKLRRRLGQSDFLRRKLAVALKAAEGAWAH